MQCNTEPLKPYALSLYLSVLRLIFFPLLCGQRYSCFVKVPFCARRQRQPVFRGPLGLKARSAGAAAAAAAAETVQPEIFLFGADSANLTTVVSGFIFGLLSGGLPSLPFCSF